MKVLKFDNHKTRRPDLAGGMIGANQVYVPFPTLEVGTIMFTLAR